MKLFFTGETEYLLEEKRYKPAESRDFTQCLIRQAHNTVNLYIDGDPLPRTTRQNIRH